MQRYILRYAAGTALIVAAAYLAAGYLGADAPAMAQSGGDAQKENVITVTGEGVTVGAPDTARLMLGVETQRKTAQEAQAANAEATAAVLKAVEALGVKKDELSTSRLELSPVMDYSDNGAPPRVTGFRAANVVTVTTGRLELVGRIVDQGVSAGANVVQGISFTIKDDRDLRLKALAEAVNDARARADALAAAAGVSVKGVVSMQASEGPGYPVFNDEVRLMKAPALETPVLPGVLEVRATATVTFRF